MEEQNPNSEGVSLQQMQEQFQSPQSLDPSLLPPQSLDLDNPSQPTFESISPHDTHSPMQIPEVNAESFFNKTGKYQVPRVQKVSKIDKITNPFQESLQEIFEDSDMEGSYLEDDDEEEEKLQLEPTKTKQKILTME